MKKTKIKLTKKDKSFLSNLAKEKLSHRVHNRVQILLLSNRGKTNKEIVDFLQTSSDTIWRTRKKFTEEGVKVAISEKPRPGQPRKYKMIHETELTAIACSDPPEGRKRWTLELLTEKMRMSVENSKTINRETVRLMLKKTIANHGYQKCGVYQK